VRLPTVLQKPVAEHLDRYRVKTAKRLQHGEEVIDLFEKVNRRPPALDLDRPVTPVLVRVRISVRRAVAETAIEPVEVEGAEAEDGD
jgi:hypothetical protein